ncbi:MAG: hypothetical protein Athens071416_577 [Parcubacteria group bacterium Athens0714_16]|nr:MAG: hypothetical protein Athens071416_577 [Parcubacteria group bacterium Athens0714_16]
MNKKYKDIDKEKLDRVIFHCEMFMYGSNFPEYMENFGYGNNIPGEYNRFAGLHLISTMFLNKDRSEPKGQKMYGLCYRLLKPMNLNKLLLPIEEILNKKIGNTTFGNCIKETRTNYATHGKFNFEDLSDEVKKIRQVHKHHFALFMEEFVIEVGTLLEKLENIRKKIE